MGVYEDLNNISLLWPDKNDRYNTESKLYQMSLTDLGIDELVESISIDKKYNKFFKAQLERLCVDTDVINYRLDIMEDLLQCPSLAVTFESLIPMLGELSDAKSNVTTGLPPIIVTVRRFAELEMFVECINLISASFHECGAGIKSPGLRRLKDTIKRVTEDEQYKSLLKNLPELRTGFERLSSVTVGINLDGLLKPVEATILSVNEYKFKGGAFMDRLFGVKSSKNECRGISELHSIDPKMRTPGEIMKTINTSKDSFSQALQATLFFDLERIINHAFEPVSAAIIGYTRINGVFLSDIEPELAFYLSALRLVKRLKKCNMPVCRPKIIPMEHKVFRVKDNFSIHLAIRKMFLDSEQNLYGKVIANDVSFDEHGRIFILTGPNQGGKTTYIQAIGVTQILMQAGMFVPGESAEISPVDDILTHFPVEEKPDANTGRLGEEARRLGEIFNKASQYSMVILNESLSSTSPGESLYMCEDIVRGLRFLGSRAVFATHLHDLAMKADAINTEIPGDSPVISLVAGAEKVVDSEGAARRTYRVIPSPPRGMSYARDIASRYGISFNQILETLSKRNLS